MDARIVADAAPVPARNASAQRSGDGDADEGETGYAAEVTWLARTGEGVVGGGLRETTARAPVVATGAIERAVLFPGGELPGVMSVGAGQGALKQGALVPSGPDIVFAGHGPLLHLALAQVHAAGGEVDTILDLSPPGAHREAWHALPMALAADPALLLEGARLLHASRASRSRHDDRSKRRARNARAVSTGSVA